MATVCCEPAKGLPTASVAAPGSSCAPADTGFRLRANSTGETKPAHLLTIMILRLHSLWQVSPNCN
eukprot:499069-Rhodomonas_salina.2